MQTERVPFQIDRGVPQSLRGQRESDWHIMTVGEFEDPWERNGDPFLMAPVEDDFTISRRAPFDMAKDEDSKPSGCGQRRFRLCPVSIKLLVCFLEDFIEGARASHPELAGSLSSVRGPTMSGPGASTGFSVA